MDWQERSRRLIGSANISRLSQAHVLLCGLGGVGSFAAEALVRSGIGRLSLVEDDSITASNLNRQLPAHTGTLGQAKIAVCAERLKEINPAVQLEVYPLHLQEATIPQVFAGVALDFVADAIDDVPAKVLLACEAKKRGFPLISAVGTGFRLDGTKLAIVDISKTHTCPLARRFRRLLKEAGISDSLPVVWSSEPPLGYHKEFSIEDKTAAADAGSKGPASMIFVPAAAGLLMASYIVRTLCSEDKIKPWPAEKEG